MEKCIVCGKEIGSFEKKTKTAYGNLCSACSKLIPETAKESVTAMSAAETKELIAYEKRLRKIPFDESASFGKLHIDESHGIFCFDSPNKGVYHCLDLTDFSLFLDDPRAFSKGTREGVIADVYMRCVFAHPMMSFKIKLEGGKVCESKRKNSSELVWKEPGQMTVIRSMFYQMLRNENEKYTVFYNEKFMSKEKIDLFKAETMFLLPDGYDISEINDSYRRITASFGDRCQSEIDEAYGTLVSAVRRKGGDEL